MNTFHLTGRTAAGTSWEVRGNRGGLRVKFGRFRLAASFVEGASLAEIARTVTVSNEVVK